MRLTHSEVVEILHLIDTCGIGSFVLETNEMRLRVVKGTMTGPDESGSTARPAHLESQQSAQGPLVAGPSNGGASLKEERAAAESWNQGGGASALVPVTAPMIGTFYRAPSPGAPPFVEVGQAVQPDTAIGIVEVMKLMNTIVAGVEGRVVDVKVANGELVEFGTVLMFIEPSETKNA